MHDVRPLTPEDMDAYVVLRREMLADAPWAFGSSPGHDRAGDIEGLQRSVASTEFVILGYRAAGRLAGAAGMYRAPEPKRRHVAEVWGVYVSPPFRRCGAARAIMGKVIEVARGWEGVESVRLSVSSESPGAKALYESLGFVTWGVEPDCIRLNAGKPGPSEYHMALALTGRG